MNEDTLDFSVNPLRSGTPIAGTLAAQTGESQGTVAAKLDAQIREEQQKRMMNPSAYVNINTPYDVVKDAAKKVKVDLMHPEMDIPEDKPTTTEQAPGANQFSVDEMNDWDTAAEWANSMNPETDDISGMGIAMNEPVDAGSVNGDSDMTNQSLDMINSIQPTPEQPGPEVDVVPDGEVAGDDTGEVAGEGEQVEEDPSLVAGDAI